MKVFVNDVLQYEIINSFNEKLRVVIFYPTYYFAVIANRYIYYWQYICRAKYYTISENESVT